MSAPAFVIGVFSQPVSSFEKWKKRGINTLVSAETEGGRIKKADWEQAATSAGLFFMDYPSDDDAQLQNEANQTHRLAFMQDDEPDLTRDPSKYPDRFINEGPYKGWTRSEILVQRYIRCKKVAPQMPVLVNFAGPQVTPDAYTHGQGHKPYIAAADWLAHDWYVKNKNFARYPVSLIGKAMDRLAAWSAGQNEPTGKPQFVFIECSDQKISSLGRCPTADEVEEEVNLAVAKGAKGIIFFPQRPPPGFSFDAMPADIEQRIIQINQRLIPTSPPQSGISEVLNRINAVSQQIQAVAAELHALGARRLRGTLDAIWEDS